MSWSNALGNPFTNDMPLRRAVFACGCHEDFAGRTIPDQCPTCPNGPEVSVLSIFDCAACQRRMFFEPGDAVKEWPCGGDGDHGAAPQMVEALS